MSVLLREIRRFKADAARVLEEAGLRTDPDIQSLTREELHELFPGNKNLKLRRNIFDIIHKQTPVDQLLRDLKHFIPHDSFRAALTNNGVLVDYLRILKDMKTQMNNIQSFLDAHIGFLEEFSTPRPDQESAAGSPVRPHNGPPDGRPQGPQGPQRAQGPQGTPILDASRLMVSVADQAAGRPQGPQRSPSVRSTSAIYGPMDYGQPDHHHPSLPGARGPDPFDVSGTIGPAGGQPQEPQEESFTILSKQDGMEATLKYHMVVGGKTFGTHVKLMEKVKEQVQNLVQLRESETDHKITFVFCPISSRIASDVEAAMSDVKDDKPVILVLMHHTREAKYTTPMRTWGYYDKVVLYVNVFYHETIHDLLKCEQNNAAVTGIGNILQERFIERGTGASGNAQGVGTESLTVSTSVRDSGNNSRHQGDISSGSSIFSLFRRGN